MEAVLRRTNAVMWWLRKSTSPTSTFDASAPGGSFFMKCMLPRESSLCEPSLEISFGTEPTFGSSSWFPTGAFVFSGEPSPSPSTPLLLCRFLPCEKDRPMSEMERTALRKPPWLEPLALLVLLAYSYTDNR